MATVTTGHLTHGGEFNVAIDGLQYPANEYDEFRAKLYVDGSFKEEITWTSGSTSNSTGEWYNYTQEIVGSYYSDAYATYNGVEYYVGRG